MEKSDNTTKDNVDWMYIYSGNKIKIDGVVHPRTHPTLFEE